MADGATRLETPLFLPAVRIPGVEISSVSAHEGQPAAHNDYGARAGQLAPEFLAPHQLQRASRKVRIKPPPLQIPMQCGPFHSAVLRRLACHAGACEEEQRKPEAQFHREP